MTSSPLLWLTFVLTLLASTPALWRCWQQEPALAGKLILSLFWLMGMAGLLLAALDISLPNLDDFVTAIFKPVAHKLGLL